MKHCPLHVCSSHQALNSVWSNSCETWNFYGVVDIGESLIEGSALALVNGEPWDMHKPLQTDCEVSFIHYTQEDPTVANQVSLYSIQYDVM